MTVTLECKLVLQYELCATSSGPQNTTVYWRIVGSSSYQSEIIQDFPGAGPYTWEKIVTCAQDQGCPYAGIQYEGYVEGCDGIQKPFTATLTDYYAPPCYQAETTCVSGSIVTAIGAGGSGYSSGDTISFTGGGGSGGTGVITNLAPFGGTLLGAITVTNGGSGYTSPPSFTVVTGSGTGGSIIPVLQACPPLKHGNCSGQEGGNTGLSDDVVLPVGSSFIECIDPDIWAEREASLSPEDQARMNSTILPINCTCSDCKSATIVNLTQNDLTVLYNTCDSSNEGTPVSPIPAGSLVYKELKAGVNYTTPCHAICETITTTIGNGPINVENCTDCPEGGGSGGPDGGGGAEEGDGEGDPEEGTNSTPQITSNPETTSNAGETYTYNVTAVDSDGDPITLEATTLPSWATFTDNGDGTGVITGTPSDEETYDFTITASDGGAETDEQTWTVAVTDLQFYYTFRICSYCGNWTGTTNFAYSYDQFNDDQNSEGTGCGGSLIPGGYLKINPGTYGTPAEFNALELGDTVKFQYLNTDFPCDDGTDDTQTFTWTCCYVLEGKVTTLPQLDPNHININGQSQPMTPYISMVEVIDVDCGENPQGAIYEGNEMEVYEACTSSSFVKNEG